MASDSGRVGSGSADSSFAAGGEISRPRGSGRIYQQKRSSIWWIQFYRNGKMYREPAVLKGSESGHPFRAPRRIAIQAVLLLFSAFLTDNQPPLPDTT